MEGGAISMRLRKPREHVRHSLSLRLWEQLDIAHPSAVTSEGIES